MTKQIEYNVEARQKLLNGIEKLSNAVISTLGPFGRNVLFLQDGEIKSTKDGVSVAKTITLSDPIENMGAEIVKQAAIKSANQAGDGTTTTTLLAHSMVKEGISKIRSGANAVEIKKGIDEATQEVIQWLRSNSQEITSEEQLKQVASVSANNDEKTGELITTALEKVGKDGIVTIEESKTGETYLEVVEGMQFDRGYKSPYFVTNNSTMQCVLENPFVFIYDGRISQAKDLLPTLEYVSINNGSLLIVAEDIGDEALATLIINKARGTLKVCAVKAPDFGDRRTLILEDMAILTGGTVISPNKGMRLDKIGKDNIVTYLGKAGRITVNKEQTTIIDGKGEEDSILKHAEEIKTQIENATSMFEIEKLQERLAKLTSGVSIIYVGGSSEIEMREYKDRVEDALYATKAAIEEGILPGGGSALLRAEAAITPSKLDWVNEGKNIVKQSLQKPFIQILTNAGYNNPEEYMYNIKNKKDKWMGYDLKSCSYVNMLKQGILDPTKVVRLALENAASVAGSVLITEAVIFEEPSSKKEGGDDLDMSQFGGM